MPTTIKLKNSVTTTSVPSSLVQGEVAINITDKKVWVGNAATTPIQLLGDGGSVTFTSLTVTGVSTFSAGTVSAPSITTSGDTNTGIFFPAADTIAFTEGGVESMRITSAGNVGIGTSSPNSTLEVNGEIRITRPSVNTQYLKLYANVSGTFIEGVSASGNAKPLSIQTDTNSTLLNLTTIAAQPIIFNTTNTERMRIDSSGNVGIGTSSPSVGRLTVQTATSTRGLAHTDGTKSFSTYIDSSGVWLGSYSNDNVLFYTNNGAAQLTLNTSGNLGLGVTPSAWNTDYRTYQLAGGGALFNNGGNNFLALSQNLFVNSAAENRYIATAAATRYRQSAGTHLWDIAPSGTAGNAITFTQAMTLDASGNLLVGITSARSNAGDVQVSKGISFPATQSAQSDANTLDDYEEGTWTPTILGGTTAGTTTYNGTQRGTYTKIGRQVTVDFYVNVTATTGTGALRIGGLPFSQSGSGDPTGSAMVDSLDWTAGTYLILRGAGTTQLTIYGCTDNAAWTNQQITNETFDITGTITYLV